MAAWRDDARFPVRQRDGRPYAGGVRRARIHVPAPGAGVVFKEAAGFPKGLK
jgi:hypothetical protein